MRKDHMAYFAGTVLSQKRHATMGKNVDCSGLIPESEGSISPANFHG